MSVESSGARVESSGKLGRRGENSGQPAPATRHTTPNSPIQHTTIHSNITTTTRRAPIQRIQIQFKVRAYKMAAVLPAPTSGGGNDPNRLPLDLSLPADAPDIPDHHVCTKCGLSKPATEFVAKYANRPPTK